MPDEDHDDAEVRIFNLPVSIPVAVPACVDAAKDLGVDLRPTTLTVPPPTKSLISVKTNPSVFVTLQAAADEGTEVLVRVREEEQPEGGRRSTITFDLDRYQSLIESRLGPPSTASGALRRLDVRPHRTVGPTRVNVFVSYRRGDARDSVGRITDHLMAHFGEDTIFHDVDSIPVGRDFRKYISSAVEACDVLLAIIGPDWMEKDTEGSLRISLPNDFVRTEIAAALQRDVPVVPVLVRQAKLPTEAQLPHDVRPLIYRQAIVVRSDPDFRSDVQRLIREIERTVATPEE